MLKIVGHNSIHYLSPVIPDVGDKSYFLFIQEDGIQLLEDEIVLREWKLNSAEVKCYYEKDPAVYFSDEHVKELTYAHAYYYTRGIQYVKTASWCSKEEIDKIIEVNKNA